MKAFYINLDRRVDRDKAFINSCPLEIKIERFSAIDGRKDVDNQNYLYLRKHMNQLNTGEYGCFASHLTLWQQLIKSNDTHYLIFEDDAIFCKDFNTKFIKCLPYINNIKTILYLGGRFTPEFTSQFNIPINSRICKHNYNFTWHDESCDRTAHAYVIHRDFAKILIDEIEQPNYSDPLDAYIIHTLRKHKLDIYNTLPLLCHSIEVANDSDIRNEGY